MSLVEHTSKFKTIISSLDNGYDLKTQRKDKTWSNAKTCQIHEQFIKIATNFS
jgi:hypothetical protein